MATEDLKEAARGGVVTLTLNRPARRNALTAEMLEALIESLERLALDPAARAIVLTGSGEAFCSGADVNGMEARGSFPLHQLTESLQQRQRAFRTLLAFPKPAIARMRGACAGAGFSLALACDFRIAARSVRFTAAFARIGMSGDNGISWLLPRIVGPARARELLMLGDTMDADAALASGLLTALVDDEALDAEVERLATRLAQAPTVALGCIKRNLAAAEHLGPAEAMAVETANQALCMHTADHKEGIAAFLQKRAPVFTGQ